MKTILAIFIGGGLGSVTRYLLGNWVSRLFTNPFPFGTLTVNLTACFLAGLLAGFVSKDDAMKSFLVIGFCGGFSTFSAFTLDSAKLFNSGLPGQMLLYIALSLIGCVAATFVGAWMGSR